MRKSHRMSHPHPQPSLFPLKPFPLPQQQSNKSGNRQLPKPPSHPLLLVWQFVAAKSLMLSTSNVYLQFYSMPGGGNVSVKMASGAPWVWRWMVLEG